MAERFDAVIVGAGVAGLACAVQLHAAGKRVVVVEAGAGIGGRVRSEIVDGNVLDTGAPFVFTGAPELARALDLDALELRRFGRGVAIRTADATVRLVHPATEPTSILASVKAPIGTLGDKARLVKLLHGLEAHRAAGLGVAMRARLTDLGFSETFSDGFFGPLLGILGGDSSLRNASGFDEELLQLFWGDGVAIPARGMQAIPDQLAGRLPAETVRLGVPVGAVEAGAVTLEDGRRISTPSVVVATTGSEARRLCGHAIGACGARSVSVLHFSAPEPPFSDPMPFVACSGSSVHVVTVPTLVSGRYRSGGGHLVSVRLVDDASPNSDAGSSVGSRRVDAVSLNPAAVRDAARVWFGDTVTRWTHLRTYHSPEAWPLQGNNEVSGLQRSVQPEGLAEGIFVCGDHRESATIHGALLSGRRAADAILTSAR